MLITDSFFYLCAIPAVLLFGLAKGGFGGAIGILSVPLMSLAVSPPQAAAILLPILCVMDLLALRKFWKSWHLENLKIMIPGAILGIGIGAFTFQFLTEAYVRILIGTLALGFALHFWLKPQQTQAAGPNRIKGTLWSMLSGFTSFGIHAGGPPANVYLLPQRLTPRLFVGTNTVFFTVVNYVKLIPYFWLGQLDAANLVTSLALLPLAPIGIGLGYFLHKKISQVIFYRIVNSFLMLAGAKLIADGWLLL